MPKSTSKKRISSQTLPQTEFSLLSRTLSSNKFSFILGLLIVLIIGGIIFSVLRNSQLSTSSLGLTNKISQLFTPDKTSEQPTPEVNDSNYVVKQGDTLWSIAQSTYGSGYNATDIAWANKMTNPDLIEVGQKILLPDSAPRAPTAGEVVMAHTSQVTFTGSDYTVKSGDCLWNIAVAAYGDGYSWTRIAKANSIPNPDIIYPNTSLKIPR